MKLTKICKVKTYLRTTLLKTFYNNVKRVVLKYFSNHEVEANNIDEQVNQIVAHGSWAAEIPTPSDKSFCQILVWPCLLQIISNRLR